MVETGESHEYQDYEIPLETKESIKEIERLLHEGLYDDQDTVRGHLDLLEDADAAITEAMGVERSIGRYNATLKHDQDKIRAIMKKLEAELNKLDNVEKP